MSVVELVGLGILLCAAGAIAGITSGLFGIGGGFVVVPVLLAILPLFGGADDQLIHVAIGTSLASIVISSARAVQAHRARGAVDFGVLRDWSLWLVIGVLIGLYIASIADGRKLVLVFAIGVLLYSAYFLFPGLFAGITRSLQMPTGMAKISLASFLGGFSALLGIGGGTVTVMTMVLCNRPVHQAVATAAGVGFIIGLPGALGFNPHRPQRSRFTLWFIGLCERARAAGDQRGFDFYGTGRRPLGPQPERSSPETAVWRLSGVRVDDHVLQRARLRAPLNLTYCAIRV